MSTLLQIPCLVLAVPCVYVCWIPPTIAEDNEIVVQETLFTHLTHAAGWLNLIFQGSIYLLKAIIIGMLYMQSGTSGHSRPVQDYDSSLYWGASALCLNHDPTRLAQPTQLFYGGFLCMVIATIIRLQSYHAMENQFTFDVSLRSGHKLITAGPYQYVRHPGYTGFFLVVASGLAMIYTKGSWLRECGALESRLGKVLVAAFMTWWVNVVVRLWRRIETEDKLLKAKFGTQWTEWKRKVPYKLIPAVY
ncbi:hypothetical protein BDP27DRAFT_1290317 [Rhodocollybia butyracea]|uniref:Protein-S-isoprenylcysteine O-methyltransferase n=1 Tax=Rhodocollybia butyracea TaxID=206335 RepID=A0A9P5Q207_9AGAR|nr:hypothetical protein BDP27DRAFT_1290317 [Rhodocollybia butyracea]